MSGTSLPILYRDFYDIPRAFVVDHRGRMYLFDCPFKPDLDDYAETYQVYVVPEDLRRRISEISWIDLGNRCSPAGSVPTVAVEFDASKRKSICARVFDLLEEQ